MRGARKKKGHLSPHSTVDTPDTTREAKCSLGLVWVVVGAETVGTGEGVASVDGLSNVLSAQGCGCEAHTRGTSDVLQTSRSSLSLRHPRTSTTRLCRQDRPQTINNLEERER